MEERIGEAGGRAMTEFGSSGGASASELLADFKFRVVSNLSECPKRVEEMF